MSVLLNSILSALHKSRVHNDAQCFFKFMLNGSLTDRVILHLDGEAAPDMVGAFLDYCTRWEESEDGYLGTPVKVCRIRFHTVVNILLNLFF